MYQYAAKLIRCVDGDTVVLDLDLGFNEWRMGQHYRLLRINAPELNDPTDAGIHAKAGLEGFLPGKSLLAMTQKSDSFGRWRRRERIGLDGRERLREVRGVQVTHAEMIAKLRLIASNGPEPMFPEDELRAIADALEQEQRAISELRDILVVQAALDRPPSRGLLQSWADALSKVIGDGK